ncbi:cobalt transporter [Isoptericola chiayiensis]|uniref:Cobalt transporter n=1 Tax=Isoptericola chiayiensis TaxID=579446 RepID=A0ABP8YKL1_9MICO|nr:hypothetical protein [Isoptericola chiayiensis]NOW01024.1 hypothetical protein [Isoptericola chiayiensis]
MARRRPAARTAGAVVAVLTVGAAAVLGVVWALSARDAGPLRESCAARLDGVEHELTTVQAQNTALIVGTTIQRGLPARAATIGVATAMQESRIVNIDYGDRDSVGLFQQRPSQGWGAVEQIMDPVYSTGAFYDGLVEVDGWESMEVTDAAQAVQRSAFPEAYAQHEQLARAWASSLTGHSPGSVTCDLRPVDAGSDAVGVADRIARDLGVPGDAVTTDGATVRIDASVLGYDDRSRSTWAVAHWAVATASATGVVEVRAGELVWTREAVDWREAGSAPEPPGRGEVVLRLAG